MEIHREKSNQLGLMANYILECSSNMPIQSDKLKKDAREALNKIEKDEADWEEKVDSWRSLNRKWLRPNKKKTEKEKVEVQVDTSRGSKSRFIESLARDLRPSERKDN